MNSKSFLKKHPKLTILLFNIVLLLFIFIIFEICLRLFAPDWLSNRMKMMNSGKLTGYGTDANWDLKYQNGQFFSLTPNSTFKIYHFEYENTVHVNHLGTRSNHPRQQEDTTNIIPFIGDSFIMGVGVEDTETVVALSKKITGYNFLNLGIAGTGLPIQRKIIDMRYEEFGKPETVIYGFWLGNDFDDIIKDYAKQSADSINIADTTKQEKKPFRPGLMWRINYYINHNKILKRLYTLQFIKQKILNLQNKKGNNIYTAFSILDTTNKEYIKKSKFLLDKELEILSKKPYKPFVIIIPDKYQLNTELRNSMASYYSLDPKNMMPFIPNEIIIEALKKYNIRYIDATQCILDNQKRGALYYVQDNHLTKLGQQVLTECIVDSLKAAIEEK